MEDRDPGPCSSLVRGFQKTLLPGDMSPGSPVGDCGEGVRAENEGG